MNASRPRAGVMAILVATLGCGDESAEQPSDYPQDCHYDCFGGVDCVDGRLRIYGAGPAPCDYDWPHGVPCVSRIIECAEGCVADLDEVIEDYRRANAGLWRPPFDAPAVESLCAESAVARVGAPCAGSGDCTPSVCDQLTCDLDAQLCGVDGVVSDPAGPLAAHSLPSATLEPGGWRSHQTWLFPAEVETCEPIVLARTDTEELVSTSLYRELVASCTCGCPAETELVDRWTSFSRETTYRDTLRVRLVRMEPALAVQECCSQPDAQPVQYVRPSYWPLGAGTYEVRVALLDPDNPGCRREVGGTICAELTLPASELDHVRPPCEADAWAAGTFEYDGTAAYFDVSITVP